jgi:hypothetical protein
MRSEEELTSLFTEYFGDRLSPAQIDKLASDAGAAAQTRRTRTFMRGQATTSSGQPIQAAST